MPNILKGFTRPKVEAYNFPESETLQVTPDPVPEPIRETEVVEEETPETETQPAEPAIDPRKPVDYARLQAEVILNEARKQADSLIDAAQQQVRAQMEEARQAGQSEGYRDGFAQGMASATTESRLAREQQAAAQAAEVSRFLESAAWAREEMMDRSAEELKELALTIAEKVVRVSLKSSSEVVARMIQGATEKLKRRAWVHIYISGADAKGMAQIPPSLASALSAVSEHVKIVPMVDDEPGTCIVEMPDQIIDASASTQLSNIRNLISDASLRGG